MRKWLLRAAIAALVLAAVNDFGRYLEAIYNLDDAARAISFESAKIAHQDGAANSGWPSAAQSAQARGITITVYRQDPDGSVTIDATDTVEGTYLLGPARNLLAHQTLTAGYPISTEAVTAGWQ